LGGVIRNRGVAITPPILALLPEPADGAGSRVLSDALRFYFEAQVARGQGYPAFPHDPLAAAVALGPELVTTRPAAVRVEVEPTAARGRTIPDWDTGQPDALIGVDVDPSEFFDRFVQRVGALARRVG